MGKNHALSDRFETLRQQAEALIEKCPPLWKDAPSDMLQLIHELNIHQVELEIQNQELLRAQQELALLHQEYADLYEFAPCGYLTLTPEKKISHVNLTGITQLGNPRQLLISSVVTQFVHPAFKDAFVDALARAGESGDKQTVELKLNPQKKDNIWVLAEILADKNEQQEVVQWRMAMVDITQKNLVENEKKLLEKRLKLGQIQKMDSLGSLAGGIAHEFNNLLSIIMGNTQLAMAKIPPSNPAEENIKKIHNAGLQGKKIVQQLLNFTRMKTKK